MSLDAMNHVWKHTNYSHSHSYILMAIADIVNDVYENRLFMTVANLAVKSKCSERTVQRALRDFESDGWLEKLSDGGGRSPSEYKFNFVSVAGVTDCHRRGDTVVTAGVTNGVFAPITYTNIKLNSKHNDHSFIDTSEFDLFWGIYPRKVGKAVALKAFLKAVQKTSVSEIIEGANRLATDPNLDIVYCPHASTWINGERWNDELLPSRNQPKGLSTLQAMQTKPLEIG